MRLEPNQLSEGIQLTRHGAAGPGAWCCSIGTTGTASVLKEGPNWIRTDVEESARSELRSRSGLSLLAPGKEWIEGLENDKEGR